MTRRDAVIQDRVMKPAHPTRLTNRRTLRRLATSRNLSRLAAKKWLINRPFLKQL